MRVPTLPAFLSFLGPFLTSLGCLSSHALYRSDTAVLRRFGDAPVVWGSPSVALSLPFDALPLGDVQLRAAIPSAFAAGFCGLILFRWTLGLLEAEGRTSWDVWLALGAAVASCLGFPFVVGGALLGSGTVGAFAALALIFLLGRSEPREQEQRRASDRTRALLRSVLVPVLSAALLLESPPLCLAILALEFTRSLVDPRPFRQKFKLPMPGPWLRRFGALAWFALALGLFLLPQGARLFHLDASLLAEGRAHSASADVERHPLRLIGEMGFVWLPAALVGLGHGLLHSPRRILPLTAILVMDFLVPGPLELGWLYPGPTSERAALHLVAICLWAALGALGLRTTAVALEALRLGGAKLSGALLTTLGLSSALAGAEDAVSLVTRTDPKPAQLYSERMLRDLPPRALVLGRSKTVVDRLLAAQALGERPDVLVVPEPALGSSRHVRDFLTLEPALDKLVLDLNLAGLPSEYALYQLTDKRPVFVEMNTEWDVRLLSHLEPRLGLAEYSPHSLSNAERRAFLDQEEARVLELARAIRAGLGADVTTRALSEQHLQSLAVTLRRVGDAASAERLLALSVGAD